MAQPTSLAEQTQVTKLEALSSSTACGDFLAAQRGLAPVGVRYKEGLERIKQERRLIWRRAAESLFMYMAAALWFTMIASVPKMKTVDASSVVSMLFPILVGQGFAALYPSNDLSPDVWQLVLAVCVANLAAGVYALFDIVAFTAGMRSPIRLLRLAIASFNVAGCASHALVMWRKEGACFWRDVTRFHGTICFMRLLGTCVLRGIVHSSSETTYPPGRLTFTLGMLTTCIWLANFPLMASSSYRHRLAGLLARLASYPRSGSSGVSTPSPASTAEGPSVIRSKERGHAAKPMRRELQRE
jgi:hypothetical protein